MRNEHYLIARTIPIFSTLGEREFECLLNMTYLQSFPAGTQLIEEGDPSEFLHYHPEGSD